MGEESTQTEIVLALGPSGVYSRRSVTKAVEQVRNSHWTPPGQLLGYFKNSNSSQFFFLVLRLQQTFISLNPSQKKKKKKKKEKRRKTKRQ